MTAGPPLFGHLLRMTDSRGTFEHADRSEPRTEHGYCTDDMARVLVVAARDTEADHAVKGLAGVALRFLNQAQTLTGACRNRMNIKGNWTDEPALEDSWGRCVWGLGTAAAHSTVGPVRQMAVIQFERAVKARATAPRAMAFAVVGAAELLTAHPGHSMAHKLIAEYGDGLGAPSGGIGWPWPEPRLAYANAVIPEAMIAAGTAMEAGPLCQRGLDLLEWLLDHETRDGHLSPTPVGGRGPDDASPGFDQQPIEVSSLADACARAAAIDPRPVWPDGVRAAAAWFDGDNDAGVPVWDPATGAGFDGLRADGPNLNQGAESTLAVISTMQHARRFAAVAQ